MRLIKLASALLLTLGFIYFGNTHHPFDLALPPTGDFFNPFRGFWQNAESGEPTPIQTLTFAPLKQEVQVVMDDRLVPHIFADNLEDAFFIQGYLTAKYRLWQMDISVRSTGGRLAEVLGEGLLKRDQLQRRKGLLWAAENTLSVWKNSKDWPWIEAYSAGVNAWISELSPADYPLEFKMLNYTPEPWSPLKSALLVKSMAETLAARQQDLESSNMLRILGQDMFDFLYPEKNPQQSPIIPAGTPWPFESIAVDSISKTTISQALPPFRLFPNPPEFIGSNNWAVAGSKTASGHPILCNDPHLQLSLPSIWFETQIHCPEANAYGVSLPGAPGIIIGFNENIAWGMTNVGQDVMDWYTIDWANDQKEQYLIDGQEQAITYREEKIKVRGRAEPVVERVKYTHWGPVVYDSGDSPYMDMAMRWVVHDKPAERDHYEMGTFVGLMTSKNYEDYSQAISYFDSPGQNFVFAARDGDIAIKVEGKFPIKRKNQGRFVQDGSHSDQGWAGFIPNDQIPQIRNPERGFVSSANQKSTDDSYPYYYNGGFDDYRGRLLNQLLEPMQDIKVADMMQLQNNNFSLKAQEGLEVLLALVDETQLNQEEKNDLQLLRKWNYRFEKDEQAPVIFEEWCDAAYRLTFDEVLAFKDSIEILYPETWRFIALMRENPEHILFDLQVSPERENASQIATMAFHEMQKSLDENYPDGSYNWQIYKNTSINHLARIPSFSVGNISVGGYAEALNAIKRNHGPSWRMIVELNDEVKAYGIYPGGQSGNPGSPFYDSMIDQWANGEYNELFFMRNAEDNRQNILSSYTFSKQ